MKEMGIGIYELSSAEWHLRSRVLILRRKKWELEYLNYPVVFLDSWGNKIHVNRVSQSVRIYTSRSTSPTKQKRDGPTDQ